MYDYQFSWYGVGPRGERVCRTETARIAQHRTRSDSRSRVCLEPLCEVGFGEPPGGQGEKRCRPVDLGRSHPHAIQLCEQERRDQRDPLVAIMKWIIPCDPKGERGSEVADGRVNFVSRLVLAAIERRIQQALRANIDETLPYAPDTLGKQESQSWQKTRRIGPIQPRSHLARPADVSATARSCASSKPRTVAPSPVNLVCF